MLKKGLYLAVVSILLSGVWMISGCGYRSPEHRAEQITKKIASKLELNDAQMEQLNRFKDELMDNRRQLHISWLTIEEELIAQLRSEKIDQKHLKEVITMEEAKLEEMVWSFATQLAEFHDSLTPEQRTQLIEMVDKWESHRKGHYHSGG